jgi:hypothetical protein
VEEEEEGGSQTRRGAPFVVLREEGSKPGVDKTFREEPYLVT